ncbi:MAG: NAD(P)/FAD-dependent oxidoreductase [Candidatus Woesearchaeota archaeon]|nr:NAD(P)/FAD-dependent oxidoreductase [Candidatus Woesearchaeota archaeon]
MITIIGCGPVGSYLGCLLSDKGINNTIIEEHKDIGRPEQCTGLISRNMEDIIPKDWVQKAIQNKVNGAVISCGKESFEVVAKEPKAYVFDRALFDQAIAEKAKDKGSRVLLGHKYLSHNISERGLKIGLKTGNKSVYHQSSVLVGADGPCSKVAKNSGLYGERRFWIGSQAILRAKKPFFEKDKVYVYLDKRYSDGFFAWVVPINEEKAKAGLASLSNPAEHLKRFLNDRFGRSGSDFAVEGRYGGLIPIYKRMPLQNEQKNIFLAGDAALQCKAISGGGVLNGMLAAKELSNAVSSGDFDYEKRLGKIRNNLWMHSLIRNKLNSMDDRRKGHLLNDLNNYNVKKVLEEKGDMDFPKKFVFNLLLSKPGLIKYLL